MVILTDSRGVGDQNQTALTPLSSGILAFLFQVFLFFTSYPTRIFKAFKVQNVVRINLVINSGSSAQQNKDMLIYLQ